MSESAGLQIAQSPPNKPLKAPGEYPCGRLAQLVERFVYTEDVGSSSLSSPTIPSRLLDCCF
jgi:hypothetical protein